MMRWTLTAVLILVSLACDATQGGREHAAGRGHDASEESEAKGPNGGRLLTSGAFELELGIFERGTPPEYRAWATSDGRVLEPGDFTLEVKLVRLGGREDRIAFAPRGDHLVSTSHIAEPHSFEVSIEASHAEQHHAWEFDSFEGRTRIDPDMAESRGVETEIAGPATLAKAVTVYGRARANPERVREIRARSTEGTLPHPQRSDTQECGQEED